MEAWSLHAHCLVPVTISPANKLPVDCEIPYNMARKEQIKSRKEDLFLLSQHPTSFQTTRKNQTFLEKIGSQANAEDSREEVALQRCP